MEDLFFVGPPDGAKVSDGPWTQDTVQLKNGKGLSFPGWPEGPHPYIRGPGLIGAHLTRYAGTNSGDGNRPVNAPDMERTFVISAWPETARRAATTKC